MIFFNRLALTLFLIVSSINTACVSQTLKIKPIKIEVFHNSYVYAMNENGKYQIGSINGTWSKIHDIQEKGLSLLEHLTTTDSGILLIGSESHLDSDKSTYYTGLITLINSDNKTIKEWRHKTNFLHVSSYKNQILLTSFDGIYSLDIDGKIQPIMKNIKRNKLSLLHDNEGNLIICHPTSPSKNSFFSTGNATCEKEDGWQFEGSWYAPNDIYIPRPIVCGSWLIEPIQIKNKQPISGVIIRNIKTGEINTKQKIPDAQQYFCVNDSELIFNTSVQSYSLPNLKLKTKYVCYKKELIISIKTSKNKTICLTTNGHIGELQKSN